MSVFDTINAEAAKADIKETPLRDGIVVIEGSGGNITVLSGDDGKFLVDAGMALSNPTLSDVLARIPGEYRYVVNTHWHWDHTDGNAWLHRAGATIIATPNTAHHLTVDSTVSDWQHTFPPVEKDAIPTLLLTADRTFHFDREAVIVHLLKASHTDGDISVYFKKADVLATGDTFWNGFYPFIDDEHGGGIDGTIAADNALLATTTDHTEIVPGHGPVANREQLKEFRDMLVGVRDRVAAMKSRGMSLEEVVAKKPTLSFDSKWGGFLVKPDLFTKLVYQSLPR